MPYQRREFGSANTYRARATADNAFLEARIRIVRARKGPSSVRGGSRKDLLMPLVFMLMLRYCSENALRTNGEMRVVAYE